MGYLHHHNLRDFNLKYNLNTFVETGVWKGDGVAYARECGYLNIFSIELLDQFYNAAVERFKDDAIINIVKGSTLDKMGEVLSIIPDKHGILFWLDAHLPSHYLKGKYDHDTEFPLEKELKIIKNARNDKDAFIIDDLRIYEHGPFQDGNYPGRISDNIDFIHDIFDPTHDIKKDYRDQGYIIVTPKENK